MIIVRNHRKTAADQCETTSRRMIVQLVLEVTGLDDPRHLHEYGILRESLVHERSKRTHALRIFVWVSGAERIEVYGTLRILSRCNFVRRHEENPGFRIEKSADEP